jgi:hypothetical protein
MILDMDVEKGKAPRIDRATGEPRPNQIMVRIKMVKEINMAVIKAYLTKQMPFDDHIFEAISTFITIEYLIELGLLARLS